MLAGLKRERELKIKYADVKAPLRKEIESPN